ncbi:MAG: cytidine deaminase, partial [Bryobacteraceae bacterium]
MLVVVNQKDLIELAASLARPFSPSADCTAAGVALALITVQSNVYSGVCIDTACSLGFCAEHAAVAEMLKAHESEIRMIVAVNSRGVVLPPCGRCRELLWQVDNRNESTWVVLGPTEKA